jgi:type VI secretion system Hcp family effector
MSQFYLSIKGTRQGQFKGTPNLRNSNDWMAGTRFSMQVDVPYDSGTGHPTGRRRYIPLTISKEWGAASLQILQAVANSETLNPVILEFIHTGAEGDESVWQRITLTNALIVDIRRYADFSAREIEQSPHEMEDISFVFQKIAVDDLIGSTHFLDDWSGPVAGPAGGPGRGD